MTVSPLALQPHLLSLCPLFPFTPATLLLNILYTHPLQGSCPCCSLRWGFTHSRHLGLCSSAIFSLNNSMTTPLKFWTSHSQPTLPISLSWLIFLSSTYHFLICWIFCLFILFIVSPQPDYKFLMARISANLVHSIVSSEPSTEPGTWW